MSHAQVSVPRVELIHGATDRFILEVGVRAWYRPDPGTEPLPAFINGTVRAEYRVQDIDPSCPGWSKKAADFLWIRVVRDSVSFQGTAEDDGSILDLVVAGAAERPGRQHREDHPASRAVAGAAVRGGPSAGVEAFPARFAAQPERPDRRALRSLFRWV